MPARYVARDALHLDINDICGTLLVLPYHARRTTVEVPPSSAVQLLETAVRYSAPGPRPRRRQLQNVTICLTQACNIQGTDEKVVAGVLAVRY